MVKKKESNFKLVIGIIAIISIVFILSSTSLNYNTISSYWYIENAEEFTELTIYEENISQYDNESLIDVNLKLYGKLSFNSEYDGLFGQNNIESLRFTSYDTTNEIYIQIAEFNFNTNQTLLEKLYNEYPENINQINYIFEKSILNHTINSVKIIQETDSIIEFLLDINLNYII